MVLLPDGDVLVLALSTQTGPVTSALVALFDGAAASVEPVAS